MSALGEIQESWITLSPSTGGKGELAHAHPNFPSIKILVTVEWLSCNGTEVVGILEQYQVLQSVLNAVRPQCLGFFESSVGVLDLCSPMAISKLSSLTDLIEYKPKPDARIRMQLALAVIDCIQKLFKS